MALSAEQPERRRHFRRTEDRERELALHRRPNRTVRRAAIGLLGVVAIVLAIAAVALAVSQANDRHALARATAALQTSGRAYAAVRQTEHSQAIAVVQGCERLNTKQAEDNRSQRADYLYDKVFIALVAATPARSRRQAREVREFLAPLRAAAKAKAWVPLVPDCTHVSVRYRPPRPIPFTVRQPPAAALTAAGR